MKYRKTIAPSTVRALHLSKTEPLHRRTIVFKDPWIGPGTRVPFCYKSCDASLCPVQREIPAQIIWPGCLNGPIECIINSILDLRVLTQMHLQSK